MIQNINYMMINICNNVASEHALSIIELSYGKSISLIFTIRCMLYSVIIIIIIIIIIMYCFYIAHFITAVISMRFTNNYIHTQKIYNTITRIIKIKCVSLT